VDDLEVALDGDDNQTHLSGVHARTAESVGVEQNADGVVGKRAPVSIVHKATGYVKQQEDEDDISKNEQTLSHNRNPLIPTVIP